MRKKIIHLCFCLPLFVSCMSTKPQKIMTQSDVLAAVSKLEDAFLSQQCGQVLVYKKNLEWAGIEVSQMPPVAQAGSLICSVSLLQNDKGQIKSTISKLKDLNLHYPVLNESWFHLNLSSLYNQIGDGKSAEAEKKQATELLLSQKSDAISRDFLSNGSTPLAAEQVFSTASALLNNDAPEEALAVLDRLPKEKQTAATKKLRANAVNDVVTKLRYQVHGLFVRASTQNTTDRQQTLLQCEKILENIIESYPDYTDMQAVRYNLKQIQREIGK